MGFWEELDKIITSAKVDFLEKIAPETIRKARIRNFEREEKAEEERTAKAIKEHEEDMRKRDKAVQEKIRQKNEEEMKKEDAYLYRVID